MLVGVGAEDEGSLVAVGQVDVGEAVEVVGVLPPWKGDPVPPPTRSSLDLVITDPTIPELRARI